MWGYHHIYNLICVRYTRTGVRYSAPSGLHDDGVCALALAVAHRHKAGGIGLDIRWIGLGDDKPDAVDDFLKNSGFVEVTQRDSWASRPHKWNGK